MARKATQTVSFATTKAHLSKYVDEAEHHGRRTVITRHGKPAAVLVPVPEGVAEEAAQKGMTPAQIEAFWERFKDLGDPNFDAVGDLIAGRR